MPQLQLLKKIQGNQLLFVCSSESKRTNRGFFFWQRQFDTFYIKRTLKLTAIVAAIISGFINWLCKRNRFLEILEVIDVCCVAYIFYIYIFFFSIYLIIPARGDTRIQGYLPSLNHHFSVTVLKRCLVSTGSRVCIPGSGKCSLFAAAWEWKMEHEARGQGGRQLASLHLGQESRV